MKPVLFGKKDFLLILCFFLIAAGFFIFLFFFSPQGRIAIIEHSGQEISRIDLATISEPQEIDIGGPYGIRLLAESDGIRFLSSDCPDQVCVRTGKITTPGQSAICLPAQISVRLTGKQKDIDGYTG